MPHYFKCKILPFKGCLTELIHFVWIDWLLEARLNNFADLNKDAGVGAHPLVHPACSMALTSKKEKHFPISQASTLSIGNALHYSQYSQLLGD